MLSLSVSAPTVVLMTLGRRALLSGALGSGAAFSLRPAAADEPGEKPTFRRLQQTQFIAALGDPGARSGTGAETWGLWREDPGPRGVRLNGGYAKLVQAEGRAPAGWTFDKDDWWLEEHGLIMETPGPLPASKFVREGERMRLVAPKRRYVVTGDREVTSVLTVHNDGHWELSKGTLYDVTHLPCRSARYMPASPGASCTPAQANGANFPVRPGAEMPSVDGCAKQDFAVLFVVGVEG